MPRPDRRRCEDDMQAVVPKPRAVLLPRHQLAGAPRPAAAHHEDAILPETQYTSAPVGLWPMSKTFLSVHWAGAAPGSGDVERWRTLPGDAGAAGTFFGWSHSWMDAWGRWRLAGADKIRLPDSGG